MPRRSPSRTTSVTRFWATAASIPTVPSGVAARIWDFGPPAADHLHFQVGHSRPLSLVIPDQPGLPAGGVNVQCRVGRLKPNESPIGFQFYNDPNFPVGDSTSGPENYGGTFKCTTDNPGKTGWFIHWNPSDECIVVSHPAATTYTFTAASRLCGRRLPDRQRDGPGTSGGVRRSVPGRRHGASVTRSWLCREGRGVEPFCRSAPRRQYDVWENIGGVHGRFKASQNDRPDGGLRVRLCDDRGRGSDPGPHPPLPRRRRRKRHGGDEPGHLRERSDGGDSGGSWEAPSLSTGSTTA